MSGDATAAPLDLAAATAELLRLVGDDPGRALRAADELITAAVSGADRVTESAARRLRGVAHRELNDMDAAFADLQAAIGVAEEAGARQAAAEARMSLVSVLAERGEMRAALEESERASAELTGLPAARMRAQRGAFLCRVGKFSEALEDFGRALPVLQGHGDHLWEGRTLNNRGNARIYLGQLTDAAHDLRRAEELYLASGHPLYAADARWNRGMCAAQLGDVPLALAHFDTAEARFTEHGVPAPEIYLGRCEVLLSVGLHAEALANAERALAATGSARSSLWAEAHLALAQTALATGDRDRASATARRAAELFEEQDRQSWAAVARYVQLRGEEATVTGAEALRAALDTAAELARAGWGVQELDARIIAARIALRQGDTDLGRQQLRLASHAKQSGSMAVRSRAWHAEALLRLADRDRTGAEEALRAGLEALDQHRATLGATELRVHTAVHGEELAGLGLKLALADASALEVLRWVERWRAGALRWRPVRPPDDTILAELLTDLRHVAALEEQERLDGENPSELRSRRQALERQVLTRTRHSVGDPARLTATAAAIDPDEFSARLGARALVEYLAFNDQLYAVTVRAGAVLLHKLGRAGDAKQIMDRMRFALRNVALGTSPAARLAARELLRAQAELLEDRLLRPVLGAVGDAELVVVPSAALRDVPWAVLPSCAGRPVSVVPSATLWATATASARAPFGGATSRANGRVTLVGGPGLASGVDEVTQLAAIYPAATLLHGADASAAAVLAALDGTAVAHIAAHGTVRADNPFFSALHIGDGPLTVFDLERLTAPPELVVLPACQSGITVARPGDELLGLTAALLALGSRCLVATVAPVPDSGTKELMVLLHQRLRAGEPPASALAAAQHALAGADDHETFAAAAAFACYGAGS